MFDIIDLIKAVVAKNRPVYTIWYLGTKFETPFRKKRPWLWSVTMYLIRLRAWPGPEARPVR